MIASGLLLQEVMSLLLEPWGHVSTTSRPQPDAVWVMSVETVSVEEHSELRHNEPLKTYGFTSLMSKVNVMRLRLC